MEVRIKFSTSILWRR